jgi:hypothetical protein
MKIFKYVLLPLLAAVTGSAFADVPPEATQAATDLAADAGSYMTTFIPVAAAVALAFVGIRWVKRFIGSSS